MDLALHRAHLRRAHLGVERLLRLALERNLLLQERRLLLRLGRVDEHALLLLLERDDLRLDADGLDLQSLELLRKLGLH